MFRQVAWTGTLRYLLRLVRAALQDVVEEELSSRNQQQRLHDDGKHL
jgi:hypothetical protein